MVDWISYVNRVLRPPTIERSTNGVLAVTATMVSMVVLIDWLTGPEHSAGLLYLIPVVFVACMADSKFGWVVAGVAVFAETLALELSSAPPPQLAIFINATERIVLYGVFIALVAIQRRHLNEQRHLATTDPLTGALNRMAFFDEASVALEIARRHKRPISCLYLDLDKLKVVNDRDGHVVGDQLITRFASVVRTTVRTSDLFARFGGDEFAVFLPETAAEAAEATARRILKALAADSLGPRLQASIGVAAFDEPPEAISVETMILTADRAMYDAKRSGGNTIAVSGGH